MKQILKYTILCFAILCFIQGKSQSYIQSFPEYIDKYITDKIIDSLRLNKISNYIIYQTNVDNKVVFDMSLTENDTIMVSYLLWQENGRIKSIIITDTCVYKSISEIEDNTKLFDYLHFSQLWIRNDESEMIGNKLIFIVPPTIEPYPYGKHVVVLVTPSYKRFFEFGTNAFYRLKPCRNKYRQEYLLLLDSTVFQFNQRWEYYTACTRN